MFISHKNNVLQQVHDQEWQCRRLAKGLGKSEYWAWLDSVTSGDPPVADYSGETGYTIVECTDEDVEVRLVQLNEYINHNSLPGEALVYNIKFYASKRDAEEILDIDGNSHDPKQYVQSHVVGDASAKDARILADAWTRIRRERDRLLAESDWTQANDTPLASGKVTEWGTYRTSLRDLPSDQSSKTKYSDITWPTKP